MRLIQEGPRQTGGIMVVGEAPGADEERLGRPFVGSSGHELDGELGLAGLNRRSLFLTNVCHERPPGNEIEAFFAKKSKAKGINVVAGRYPLHPVLSGLSQLQRDIDALCPRLIVALGNTALWALTGLTRIVKWRGSILEATGGPVDGHGIKLIPTMHPAYVLREYVWRAVAIQDLRRAAREAAFPEIRKPAWDFTVPTTVSQVEQWFGDHNCFDSTNETPLVADVENFYEPDRVHDGRLICLGFASDRTTAMCVPFVHRAGGDPHYWPADAELQLMGLCHRALQHRPVVFHNGLHDCQIIARNYGYLPNFRHDTMVMQHVAFPGQLGGKIDPLTGKVSKKGSSLSLSFCSSMYCRYHRFWKDDGRGWDPDIHDEDLYWRYNCLTGDTKVLTAACQWKDLSSIIVGDELLSFDEQQPNTKDLRRLLEDYDVTNPELIRKTNYARKLRLSVVEKTACATREVLKITLDDGTELKSTPEHKFLIQRKRKENEKLVNFGTLWLEAKDLSVGDQLPSIGKPWSLPDTIDQGWMGGFLDGEGSLGTVYHNTGTYLMRPSYSQKTGPVLDKARDLTLEHGFTYGSSSKSNAEYTDINGGLSEYIRFLGCFPTMRLVNRMKQGAVEYGWSGFSALPKRTVLKIESWGEEIVYDISTSTKTFIANGVIAHNCEDVVRTYEVMEELTVILRQQKLWEPYLFEMELFAPVFDMMFRGLNFDDELRKQFRREVHAEAARTQSWIDRAVGHPLNVGSNGANGQMQQLFYDDFKVPPILHRKTKKPTLDDKALETITKRKPILRPLIERIQGMRSLDVFKGNFLDVRLSKMDARLRSAINVAGPETMRFSSNINAFGEGMNLQNLPGDE